ncbi:MAG: hypothetical protein AB7D05_08290 [Mangrovibacterium sp.]
MAEINLKKELPVVRKIKGIIYLLIIFACSYDLVHWTEWNGPHLIEPSEKYDALFAHKSCVIKHDGIVYHFYNAVDKLGNRGIALATSKDIGKSGISFNAEEESAIK